MFPTVARLELDDLLTQLVDRARDVLATQSRLRGLLQANRIIATDLRLPVLLRHIVEAATDLLGARYGALGVIAPDRTLEEFVHVGMTDADVARIRYLPTGQGILGLLIDDQRPRRVDDIADDPSAYGFPPGHPPMRTFLGVPIMVRGEVFGNLYLTDKHDDAPFTAEDEELALALAANAGVAIENARLYHESQQRHLWMTASAEITRLFMAGAPDSLGMLARRVLDVADATFVALALRADDGDGDGQHARVAVAVTDQDQNHAHDRDRDRDRDRAAAGPAPAGGGRAGRRIPLEHTLTGRVLTERQALRVDNAQLDALPDERTNRTGPLMVVPLVAGTDQCDGALLVGRDHGARAFTDTDLVLATSFAGHIAIALELAHTKADQERLLVLADRGRIARDLHDHVIQRLFAVALGMQDLAQYENPSNADRITAYIENIDATIKDIRRTIFELRSTQPGRGNRLRGALEKISDDIRPALGFTPAITLSGPLDSLVDDRLTDHLIAVAREALTNTARHARATTAELRLAVLGDTITLDAVDDGVGIGDSTRRSGLDNLRTRAEIVGGTCSVTTPPGGGTHLRWTAPL
ncbi:Hypoxia sensor histidine kinase response regulator DosT [Parafrankia sp. Ea1.12]|uniref:sensor histidine kinase n=1 Tax=Parafrankia sp. Ea1.12 TaxID=573499 RepID=UPI000DA4FF60|nr:GAF domain-containing protein [Parafrankia sp. Ea1.12]SQD94446.1 Hypoxia sensor histidine kinase response regulator DosT [Parafrankia sp. Ea1.12]